MPINASILRQAYAPKVPNPVQGALTGLDLKNRMLGNQQQEMQISAAQKQQQQGEAIAAALMESNGDFEAALPKIAQIAPDLLPHYQQYVQSQKNADLTRRKDARAEAIETLKQLEGQPGQTIDVGTAPSAPMSYPGQIGEGPQNPPGTNEVGLPAQPVNIPGVYGPDVQVRPRTFLDQLRQRGREAQEKQAMELEQIRERERAQAEFAARKAPPAGTVPLSPERMKQERELRQLSNQPTPRQPVPGVDIPLSAEVEAQRSRMQATRSANNRPLTSGDTNKIADYGTSLNDVDVLKKVVSATGDTGTMAKIQASAPNWVTEMFNGWGADAKSRNAVIARVKQVIGKALEGGVLRKEDEEKYKDILPTIGDLKSVVDSKLQGLAAAISARRVELIDSLEASGFDVAKHRARINGGGAAGGSDQPIELERGPDGKLRPKQ